MLTTADLRQKIMQVETAIVHSAGNSLSNLQSVFAHTLRVDNEGIIWLLLDQTPACAPSYQSSFEVILNYHKKGLSYDLDILGQAMVVTGRELAGSNECSQDAVLLRVQVTDVDYWEQKPSVKNIIMTRFPRLFPASPGQAG